MSRTITNILDSHFRLSGGQTGEMTDIWSNPSYPRRQVSNLFNFKHKIEVLNLSFNKFIYPKTN